MRVVRGIVSSKTEVSKPSLRSLSTWLCLGQWSLQRCLSETGFWIGVALNPMTSDLVREGRGETHTWKDRVKTDTQTEPGGHSQGAPEPPDAGGGGTDPPAPPTPRGAQVPSMLLPKPGSPLPAGSAASCTRPSPDLLVTRASRADPDGSRDPPGPHEHTPARPSPLAGATHRPPLMRLPIRGLRASTLCAAALRAARAAPPLHGRLCDVP